MKPGPSFPPQFLPGSWEWHTEQKCLQAMGNSFVTLVFTQPCALASWPTSYLCEGAICSASDEVPLPLFHRRCNVPVWSAFLSWGIMVSVWPQHSLSILFPQSNSQLCYADGAKGRPASVSSPDTICSSACCLSDFCGLQEEDRKPLFFVVLCFNDVYNRHNKIKNLFKMYSIY